MAYISADGSVMQAKPRAWWQVPIDLFWSFVNGIALFFSTIFSVRAVCRVCHVGHDNLWCLFLSLRWPCFPMNSPVPCAVAVVRCCLGSHGIICVAVTRICSSHSAACLPACPRCDASCSPGLRRQYLAVQ